MRRRRNACYNRRSSSTRRFRLQRGISGRTYDARRENYSNLRGYTADSAVGHRPRAHREAEKLTLQRGAKRPKANKPASHFVMGVWRSSFDEANIIVER